MVKALFDTNLLIDYLNGGDRAQEELARFSDKAISQITWMGLIVGATSQTQATIRRFLSSFVNIPLDSAVGELAVVLRQKHELVLPDATVWATAREHGRILVTRNTKDFNAAEPGVRIPYEL